MDYGTLVGNALRMRGYAYAPYSRFLVGACLLTADGTVYGGCNVENASYSVTVCAERTALFKAVSEGHREFSAIAIVGAFQGEEVSEYCYPCGACVQAMAEFCKPDFRVVLYDGKHTEVCTLKEILPKTFTNLSHKNP
jgi:homotetrameric cytidine deaminase